MYDPISKTKGANTHHQLILAIKEFGDVFANKINEEYIVALMNACIIMRCVLLNFLILLFLWFWFRTLN